MFKDYFDYIDFIDKLKIELFDVDIHDNYCVVSCQGIEIAGITPNDIEIVDINYLIFDDIKLNDKEIDLSNKKFIKFFNQYNKFIDVVLENVKYNPDY